LFSLSLSLFFSNHHRNTKRKHTTTTNSEEKHLFLKTIIEREKSSSKILSFFFSEKNSKITHVKNKRKSAEKQPTPLINTFALVFFHHVSSSLFKITRARQT
jgi:GH15 family glucan-1,4-alpha-glucosidase